MYVWVGHMLRLPENAPVKLAFKELDIIIKVLKEIKKITWIKTVKKI
jgi:hypothetical protein